MHCERKANMLSCSTGSKIPHFQKLHEKTGIPYSEMVSRLIPVTLHYEV